MNRTTRTAEATSLWLRGWNASNEAIRLHLFENQVKEPRAIAVVLPFTAAHAGRMRPFVESLASSGVLAAALDLPGHGRSGGERGAFSVDAIFQSIRSVVEHYRTREPDLPIVLAGSSWGGDLALLYSLWEIEIERQFGIEPLIAGLFCQAVITPWQRDLFVSFRPGLSWLLDKSGLSAEIVRRVIGISLPVSRMFRASDLYELQSLRNDFASDPFVLSSYDAASYFSYLRYQPQVSPKYLAMPVRLVIGDRDRLVSPAYERAVAQRLNESGANVTLSTLPGAGHAPFEERTQQIKRLFVRWLDSEVLASTSSRDELFCLA